jgi:hypothetical protein
MKRLWPLLLVLLVIIMSLTGQLADKVKRIAHAIARAEGFFVLNSLPNRTNNPGDLKLGDMGNGTDKDKTIFATPEEGFKHLYYQVTLMLTGTSKYYRPSMSILEVAKKYTGEDAADTWAAHVVQDLRQFAGNENLTVNSTLAEIA